MLFDGWEDILRRSLYGNVAAEVKKPSVVLGLQDLTGHRGSADKLLETTEMSMKMMDLVDGRNFIALTTDNPTVMQSFRNKFQNKF